MPLSDRNQSPNLFEGAEMCESMCETPPDSAPEQGIPADNTLPSGPATDASAVTHLGVRRPGHQPWCDVVNVPEDAKVCPRCKAWRPKNTGAVTHGVRRYELRGILPEHAQQHVDAFHAGALSDRGGEANVSTIESGYIRRLAQLEGSLELLGDDIARRGVMTERGRPRAAFAAFLKTLETWDRFATRLGLERRQRHLDVHTRMAMALRKQPQEPSND